MRVRSGRWWLRPARPDTAPVITRAVAPKTRIEINAPMAAPDWALAERKLLAVNAQGVELFADKYVDGRGYLKGPTHWGIADGPDDAVEPIRNWPLAYMLGGPESIVAQWRRPDLRGAASLRAGGSDRRRRGQGL